jgi:hypothetical protein
VIRAAQERAPETWPAPLPTPLPREVRDLYDDLRKAASGVADSVGVPIEVLLRKKHIEALVLGRVDAGDQALLPGPLMAGVVSCCCPCWNLCCRKWRIHFLLWGQERQRAVAARHR